MDCSDIEADHRLMGALTAILIIVVAFAVLAVLSWNWGTDSRTGRDWEWRPEESTPASSESRLRQPARLLESARRHLAEQAEIQERLALLDRPWEETFLHWSGDPTDPRLHGQITPPRDGRRRSVTRSGWCPGLLRERDRNEPRCGSH